MWLSGKRYIRKQSNPHFIWLVSQAVKTLAFHARVRGSTLLRATIKRQTQQFAVRQHSSIRIVDLKELMLHCLVFYAYVAQLVEQRTHIP